jgi:hypothetical protein
MKNLENMSINELYEIGLSYIKDSSKNLKETSELLIDGGKSINGGYEHHRILFEVRKQRTITARISEKNNQKIFIGSTIK